MTISLAGADENARLANFERINESIVDNMPLMIGILADATYCPE